MAGLTYTIHDATDLSTSEIYGKVLCEMGEQHPDIVGLSSDLAKSTKIGLFGEKFPQRFFNMGIAEQNMFSVAAGWLKWVWFPSCLLSILASMRPLIKCTPDLFIRNLNVKIIRHMAPVLSGKRGRPIIVRGSAYKDRWANCKVLYR